MTTDQLSGQFIATLAMFSFKIINMAIEDHKTMFSLKCKMNPFRTNFKRNSKIKKRILLKKKLDHSYITWCNIINKEKEHRFKDILNRTLEEQINTLKHIKK